MKSYEIKFYINGKYFAGRCGTTEKTKKEFCKENKLSHKIIIKQ